MTAARAMGEMSDGRTFCRAVAGPFEVTRIAFPPGYAHGVTDPERGYLVVPLAGAVCKTFSRDTVTLARESFATMPAGAAHRSSFAATATEVLAVRSAPGATAPFGGLLDRRRHVRASAATSLAWRMASELRARDAGWALALEGLALELVALGSRVDDGGSRGGWLAAVRGLLESRIPDVPSLAELAASVERHPTHVSRAFRREYGVTVAEHARALRLEWAAAQLRLDGATLARIAADAGFADQSHFTRAFRRHTGVTPGRYRALAQR